MAEAEAIQEATFASLGLAPAAWKVGRRGALIFSAPMPPANRTPLPPGTLIEFEVALQLRQDVAAASLDLAALPEVADLVPLFEFVRSRFAPDAVTGDFDQVADCAANHGMAVGAATGPWNLAEVEQAEMRLFIDDTQVAHHRGPHRALPLMPLLAAWRDRAAARGRLLRAGEVVTLGSLTGMLPIPQGARRLRGEIVGRGVLDYVIA